MKEVKAHFRINDREWKKDFLIPNKLADWLHRIAKKSAKLFPGFCTWTDKDKAWGTEDW